MGDEARPAQDGAAPGGVSAGIGPIVHQPSRESAAGVKFYIRGGMLLPRGSFAVAVSSASFVPPL